MRWQRVDKTHTGLYILYVRYDSTINLMKKSVAYTGEWLGEAIKDNKFAHTHRNSAINLSYASLTL